MADKKKGKVIQMLSPENYIRQRSRSLPLHECLITPGWKEGGKASIIISRKHTNGNLTIGFFLVDLFCLGVKDAHFKFNIPQYEYRELFEDVAANIELEKIEYTLAHNIIFAAVEYAEEYGFKPVKEFTSTMQYFLAEDNDDVELMEIECGFHGQPLYARGPDESDADVDRILACLEKTAGPGNFGYIDELDDPFLDDDDEFLSEDDLDIEDFKAMLSQHSPGLQFKVQIDKITKPPVWRRIIVPAHYDFMHFHMILQESFGWWNEHYYMFSPGGYGTYPVIKEIDEDDEPRRTMEAAETLLSDIFREEGRKFTYLYDFGDDWKHTITLEKILPDEISEPDCIDGKGKCPPEDCGGPHGYMNLKEITNDPAHPDYEDMNEWLTMFDDEPWDSNAFDLEETRDLLKSFFSLENIKNLGL